MNTLNNKMVKVLIISTSDSVRSQMAKAYLQYYARKRAVVYSAGLIKGDVDPIVPKVMAEDGLDISNYTTTLLTDHDPIDYDYVVTICDSAKENSPYLPTKGLKTHWHIDPPANIDGSEEEVLNEYRWVRFYAHAFAHKFSKMHFKGMTKRN